MITNGTGARALILLLALAVSGCSSDPGPSNLQRTSASAASTPMMQAVKNGDLTQVQHLAGAGGSLNMVTEQGTPLAAAIVNEEQRIAWYLLSEGADPELADTVGRTPLMLAAGSGQRRLVELLISAGANVNATSAAGETPMTLAAMGGHLSVVKVLLGAGGNVNVSQDRRSLLMQVVSRGDLLTTEALLAAGADTHFEGPGGLTALDLARQIHSQDLEMLLIQAGAGR